MWKNDVKYLKIESVIFELWFSINEHNPVSMEETKTEKYISNSIEN